MRLVFLGAPGVGKGTQAALLSVEWTLPHIATGNLLRAAVAQRTAVGLEVQSCIQEGRLVADDLITRVTRERLQQSDAVGGYILDGFPRTIGQAEALSKMLSEQHHRLDRVVYFDLRHEVLVDRISGRRSCPACQKVYHLWYDPPRVGLLCTCGITVVQRPDDVPETVKTRLDVYQRETEPLIAYYQNQGILRQINVDMGISDVTRQVRDAVDGPLG